MVKINFIATLIILQGFFFLYGGSLCVCSTPSSLSSSSVSASSSSVSPSPGGSLCVCSTPSSLTQTCSCYYMTSAETTTSVIVTTSPTSTVGIDTGGTPATAPLEGRTTTSASEGSRDFVTTTAGLGGSSATTTVVGGGSVTTTGGGGGGGSLTTTGGGEAGGSITTTVVGGGSVTATGGGGGGDSVTTTGGGGGGGSVTTTGEGVGGGSVTTTGGGGGGVSPTTTHQPRASSSSVVLNKNPDQPPDFPCSCSYDSGKYNVSWMYNKTSEELYFKVQVDAKGWVGFGLAKDAPTNMTDYDVAVGGVYDNGSCYIQDYLTIGQMKPRLDLQQDWNGTNCSENNGVTTLFFSRAKNTSDDNDTAVQEGNPLCIIWAYHGTSDIANDTAAGFPKHTAKGFECNKTLIPGQVSSSTAATSQLPSSTQTIPPSPTSTPPSTSCSLGSVSISDWKAKGGECESKCEGGGAGPFKIERTCESKCPSQCINVNLTDTTQDCVTYCPSNAVAITASFLMLAIGVLFSVSASSYR